MYREFEIYFSDLGVEAQQRLMEAVGIKDPREMNWDLDILPIALYPIDDDDDFDSPCFADAI